MSKKFFSILIVVVLTIIPASLTAHPPAAVEASFDSETQQLTLDATHSVGSKIEKHHINKVEIEVNGVEAIIQLTSTQTDEEGISLIYLLPGVKSGDRIRIKVTCNIFGSTKFELTAE